MIVLVGRSFVLHYTTTAGCERGSTCAHQDDDGDHVGRTGVGRWVGLLTRVPLGGVDPTGKDGDTSGSIRRRRRLCHLGSNPPT